MEYGFEWDPEKAQTNRRKHGVSFEEAATAFRDPQMLTIYNGEHSNAEERWITLGISAVGRLVVVCHAFRKESAESATVRVFSARKATKNEIRQYRE